MPPESTATTTGEPAAALRDGYELHRAALRHGCGVTLYPRQVMFVTPAGQSTELTFVHGVPQSTTLAAVTYAQDKRMRRDLLARAGLPVPAGATFAIGRQVADARLFAERVGYPVVVKPAVGENFAEVLTGVQDEAGLDAAIDYLRTPELERPAFTRAAYALTLLLEPDEEDGRSVAPAGYQFLVERHVPGDYVHGLVVGDQLLAAVRRQGGTGVGSATGVTAWEVTDELHQSLTELMVGAARAIPGLALAAVGLVVADHRRPAADQQPWVVDFSERPQLAVPAAASEELSRRLGETILAHHAAQRSTPLGPARDEVTVTVHIEGCTDPDGVAGALTVVAAERGVSGTVSVADRIDGTATGTLTGPPDTLALMFELLLDGDLRGQRAMLVEQRQH